ncbi:hypothetical protein FKW77_006008 [Venturia effusa]|uniref:Uncharacterized protein n=1 Tax=Venturia effusa TaxID=50376 RepID=A0A517L5J2_9PEZI|nr:hypothetical protein FKW77_006008 [Venturia effusa]
MAPRTRKKELAPDKGSKPTILSTNPTAPQPTHNRVTRAASTYNQDLSNGDGGAGPLVQTKYVASSLRSRKRAHGEEDRDMIEGSMPPKRARKEGRPSREEEKREVYHDVQAWVQKRTPEIRNIVRDLGQPITSRRPHPYPEHTWKTDSREHPQEIADLIYEHRFLERVNKELIGLHTRDQIDAARQRIDIEWPAMKLVHVEFPLKPCEIPEGEYLHTALPSELEREWVDPVEEYAWAAWIDKPEGQSYHRRRIIKRKEKAIGEWMEWNEQPFSKDEALAGRRPYGAGKEPKELKTWENFRAWPARKTSTNAEKIRFEAWKRRRVVRQFMTVRASVMRDVVNTDLSLEDRDDAEALLQSMPVLEGPESAADAELTSDAEPTNDAEQTTDAESTIDTGPSQ